MTAASRKCLFRRIAVVILVTATPVSLLQCDSKRPGETKGRLEIRVKDHRNAIDDFKELQLTIGAVRLSPDATLKSTDPGWVELVPKVDQFDLTRYKDADSLLIYEGDQARRAFEAIDLKISETKGVLAKTNALANVENNVRPIRLHFAIEPGVTATVILDLEVLDLSDHPAGGYDLRMLGYELFSDGKLLEKVPPG